MTLCICHIPIQEIFVSTRVVADESRCDQAVEASLGDAAVVELEARRHRNHEVFQ